MMWKHLSRKQECRGKNKSSTNRCWSIKEKEKRKKRLKSKKNHQSNSSNLFSVKTKMMKMMKWMRIEKEQKIVRVCIWIWLYLCQKLFIKTITKPSFLFSFKIDMISITLNVLFLKFNQSPLPSLSSPFFSFIIPTLSSLYDFRNISRYFLVSLKINLHTIKATNKTKFKWNV